MIRFKALTRPLHLIPYHQSPKSLIKYSVSNIHTSSSFTSKTKFSRKKYLELNSEQIQKSLAEKQKEKLDGVARVTDEKLYNYNAHQIDIKAKMHPVAKHESGLSV